MILSPFLRFWAASGKCTVKLPRPVWTETIPFGSTDCTVPAMSCWPFTLLVALALGMRAGNCCVGCCAGVVWNGGGCVTPGCVLCGCARVAGAVCANASGAVQAKATAAARLKNECRRFMESSLLEESPY